MHVSIPATYEFLLTLLHGSIKWLAEFPDGTFIGIAVIFVLMALILRDALAFLWASLCCLVIIGTLGLKDHRYAIFILFVSASSLLVIVRERLWTARNRQLLRQLGKLQERVERLEFAVQNQFIRSLKDLKRPTIAPGIASIDQDHNSKGTAERRTPITERTADAKHDPPQQ
jgi:hypothetical protein